MKQASKAVLTVAQVARLHLGEPVGERVEPFVLGAALVFALASAPAAAHERRDVRARVAQPPLEANKTLFKRVRTRGCVRFTGIRFTNKRLFLKHFYLRAKSSAICQNNYNY